MNIVVLCLGMIIFILLLILGKLHLIEKDFRLMIKINKRIENMNVINHLSQSSKNASCKTK